MVTEDKRALVYWSCSKDVEILQHDNQNAAIEEHLAQDLSEDVEIEVYGFSRMVVPELHERDAEELLEEFFDRNWSELQGEEVADITDEMRAAARTFLEVVHREFQPWACEIVTTETVDVAAWVKEHHPYWLEERG